MPRKARRASLAAALLPTLALFLALGGCKPADPIANAKATLADLPPRFQAADLKNGQDLFTQCRSCHTAISDGADMTGPNLHGVFGRKPASKPGYAYSDALKAYAANGGKPWTADLIDQWLSNPKGFVPGTRMSFPGYPDADNRRDVIAYLKVVSSSAP